MWLDINFWATNPFIPWDRIFSGIVLLIYLYQIWWVYRDAEKRYFSGVWFALLAAIVPLGGWLFYLLYRSSSLPELDLLEIREKLLERGSSIDYEIYLARQRQVAIERSLAWVRGFLKPPQKNLSEIKVHSYPDEIIRSREKELLKSRKENAKESFEPFLNFVENIAKGIVSAFRQIIAPNYMSVRKKLKFYDKVREAPLVDEDLENLLQSGLYILAKEDCQAKLRLASEQNDARRMRTYEVYLARINRLIKAEKEEAKA